MRTQTATPAFVFATTHAAMDGSPGGEGPTVPLLCGLMRVCVRHRSFTRPYS